MIKKIKNNKILLALVVSIALNLVFISSNILPFVKNNIFFNEIIVDGRMLNYEEVIYKKTYHIINCPIANKIPYEKLRIIELHTAKDYKLQPCTICHPPKV